MGVAHTRSVQNKLEQQGYAVRIVPIGHALDLKKTIEESHSKGLYDEELYRTYLSSFAYEAPAELPEACSIIVMAIRQPQVRMRFSWKGKEMHITVPPTYLHGAETDRKAEESLREVLAGEGFKAIPARVPKKLLAAHSGLATYGKNNVIYVQGMGSFHRICAFYSDLPCEEESWLELRTKERCADCGACMKVCPTGAITPERFLLHAEKCIVFHNEKDSKIPFPAWISSSSHNCLVGCMLCQRVCPDNKEYLSRIEDGPKFSEEETKLLLSGISADQLPGPLVAKLKESDLLGLLEVIPRNLCVLLRQSK